MIKCNGIALCDELYFELVEFENIHFTRVLGQLSHVCSFMTVRPA